MRRDAPDVQRVVRVEELGAVLARRDVDQRSAGVQRHPDARVVRRAPAVAGVATQGTRLAAAASHHCDTSYTLPRSTSQQSPGVLCCATSLSENALPLRTTVGGARCDARLPSGGIPAFTLPPWPAARKEARVSAVVVVVGYLQGADTSRGFSRVKGGEMCIL